MKRTTLSIFFFLSTTLAFASVPFIKNYPRESYQAGTQTWAITQVPGGPVFFANNDGLLVYNGKDWTLHRLNNGSSARSVFYDKKDACIYVGGTNELGRMAVSSNGPVYTSLLDSLEVYVNEIWDIGRDADGRLWFQDNHTRYTFTDERMLDRDAFVRPPLQGNVFCQARNDEYTAWGTTNDGIWLERHADGSRIHLSTENGMQNNSVLSLYFDHNGGLWAGLDRGIDYIMLENPLYRLFGNAGSFGGGYAVCEGDGYYYIGTNIGLFRVPKEKMGLSMKDADFERVQGIEGQVWSLEWIDGDVVACCDRGVFICRGSRVVRTLQTDGAWKIEPLQDHPGKYLGCSYTRFFILEKSGRTWGLAGWVAGFEDSGKTFEQDSDGHIWFAHHVKGLYRLTLSEDLQRFEKVEKFGAAQGFPTDRANYPSVFHGEILFSTEGGFYGYDKLAGKATPVHELNQRFGGTPNTIKVYETPLGNMRYYASATLQAVEFSENGGTVMDSLSLRSLIKNRPVGFECTFGLDEQNLLINTDEGFVVLNLERLLKSRNHSGGEVFISNIATTDTRETVYAGQGPQQKKEVLRLPYRQRSLQFSYANPVFDSFAPSEFSTMLKGLDKQFSEFSTESSRFYSRIPAGRYTFIVKARNPLHGNVETMDSIELVVRQPWSNSLLAWIVYILIAAVLANMGLSLLNRLTIRRARKLAAAEAEKMRQAQIQKDLQLKADDLAASTMNLQRKNELLQQIAGRVEEAMKEARSGASPERYLGRLGSALDLIRENIAHEDDWQKFQDNFDVVYDDFLKRLGQEYPQLTKNDKRICAYLRMGLCSKDISPLLGMTVRSVEMTRYRIRQKMGLTREDNLTAFLQKY